MTTSDSQIPFRGPVTQLALDREALGMIRAVAVSPLGFGRVRAHRARSLRSRADRTTTRPGVGSNTDVIGPARSARLITNLGHISILRSNALLDSLQHGLRQVDRADALDTTADGPAQLAS